MLIDTNISIYAMKPEHEIVRQFIPKNYIRFHLL